MLAMAASFLLARLPVRAARALVLLALLIVFVCLLVDAVRIMYVRRILISGSWAADLVIFFVGRDNLFLFAGCAAFALFAVWAFARSLMAKPSGENPALVRKARYGLILTRRAAVFLLITIALVFFSAQSLRAVHERGPYISEPEEVFSAEGEILLDLAVVGDGSLHRYAYKTESGTSVRFIVIKKTASAYGVGLDACDICGATGYYQRGDQVICRLCDVVMNKTTIGFPGGCNPVPLAFVIRGGKLVVKASDLEAERRRFE